MATQSTLGQGTNYRDRVLTWIENWAKPHTLCRHQQADNISLKLSQGRHLVLILPQNKEPIAILLFVQLDPPSLDHNFPNRFLSWLSEGRIDPLPDANYVPHVNAMGYGISIPMAEWSVIETQYLPMIEIIFSFLVQQHQCYQAVRHLDLDGDHALRLRDQFHAAAFIHRQDVRVFCSPLRW